jgi:DNA-directed RNA polymerase specialized sigma24 family protein
VADEEDAVARAFESFVRRTQAGQFPRLANREDLWRLLVAITGRKLKNQLRDQHAAKRGGGRVVGESALARDDAFSLDELAVSSEPSPKFAAEVAEQFQRLLGVLPDDECRAIAGMECEGFRREEIARRIGRSTPTAVIMPTGTSPPKWR